jgi:hypothetical protein
MGIYKFSSLNPFKIKEVATQSNSSLHKKNFDFIFNYGC